ncbi:MAG: hypothetical protein WAV55_12050 [Clostridiaceae bacterium]
MIVSNNKKPKLEEFSSLLKKTNQFLNEDAAKRESYYLSRNAQKLEFDVAEALTKISIGTPFENTIQVVSGQKFPDIVIGKYYGIEVKSSKDENWITLGGSVNESTRVENVERIFLTFGKLISPIEFKTRPYEDCLSDVVVTHYPRYKINMNLESGNTIFDKMDTTYQKLRTGLNPVRNIVEYYKAQLKEGESLWWIDTHDNPENSNTASIKIRLWRTLSKAEKHKFMILGFALFPNILSDNPQKYENFSLWLVSRYGVVSTSLRDTFTAGGQKDLETSDGLFPKMPQAINKLFSYNKEISQYILTADEDILKETWKTNHIDLDRIGQWIEIVTKSYRVPNFDTHQIFKAIFDDKSSIKELIVAEDNNSYK